MKFNLIGDDSKQSFKNMYYLCFIIMFFIKLPVFILGFIINPRPIADSMQYVTVAAYNFNNLRFFTERPFGYPLFIKILGLNLHYVVFVQFIISIFAWSLLYYYLKISSIKPILKKLLTGIIFILVASVQITNWDNKVLTESLTVSSLCLSFTLIYAVYNYGGNIIKFSGLILSIILLISLRDSNYIIALFLLAFILFSKKFSLLSKIFITGFICVFIGFIISTSQIGGRQKINLGDCLVGYIYANDAYNHDYYSSGVHEYYQWYTTHTSVPQLKSIYDECMKDKDKETMMYKCFPYDNKDMQQYINSTNLKNDYVKFILSNPFFVLFDHFEHLPRTRFLIFGISYTEYGGQSLLNSALYSYLVNISNVIYGVAVVILYGIFGISLFRKKFLIKREVGLFYVYALLIPSWLFAILIFIGDPMELGRHVLAGSWYMLIGSIVTLMHVFNSDNNVL